MAYTIEDQVWRVDVASGDVESVTAGRDPLWSRDASKIYVQDSLRRNWWEYTLDDRSRRQVTRFEGRRGGLDARGGGGASGDGYLYFEWEDDEGDIWTLDLVMDEE